MFDDRFSEEVVPEWGAVSAKGLGLTQFVHGLFHRLACAGGKWLGHVAHAAVDELRACLWMCFEVLAYASVYLGEEIACSEFEVMLVDQDHGVPRRQLWTVCSTPCRRTA